jgi:hypothetical protein
MAAMAPGCTSDAETRALVETLPFAASTGNAQHLAQCIRTDLVAATGIAEADKAELRARADVLEAHAVRLGEAVDQYTTNSGSTTLENLRARTRALEEELRGTWRAWGYWQVQHGRRSADEVSEVFDFSAGTR